jgi:hypothetical protein
MADDLKKSGPADSARINIHEAHERAYWTKKFGCSEAALKEAVGAVGVMADKVDAFLKSKKII